jgi:hypothetical protein
MKRVGIPEGNWCGPDPASAAAVPGNQRVLPGGAGPRVARDRPVQCPPSRVKDPNLSAADAAGEPDSRAGRARDQSGAQQHARSTGEGPRLWRNDSSYYRVDHVPGPSKSVVLLYFLPGLGRTIYSRRSRGLLPHRRNREDAVAIAREAGGLDQPIPSHAKARSTWERASLSR